MNVGLFKTKKLPKCYFYELYWTTQCDRENIRLDHDFYVLLTFLTLLNINEDCHQLLVNQQTKLHQEGSAINGAIPSSSLWKGFICLKLIFFFFSKLESILLKSYWIWFKYYCTCRVWNLILKNEKKSLKLQSLVIYINIFIYPKAVRIC